LGVNYTDEFEAQGSQIVTALTDDLLPLSLVADDTALANPSLSHLELGLYQDQEPPFSDDKRQYGRNHLDHGNERKIHGDQIANSRDGIALQMASVDSFHDHHPIILSQLKVELTSSDVHRIDPIGTLLQ
jgi:hypothetical protein